MNLFCFCFKYSSVTSLNVNKIKFYWLICEESSITDNRLANHVIRFLPIDLEHPC